MARTRKPLLPGEAEAWEEALDRVGGITAMAAKLRELGDPVTMEAVCQWRRVPPLRVLDVEKVSGVPKERIRPDLYK